MDYEILLSGKKNNHKKAFVIETKRWKVAEVPFAYIPKFYINAKNLILVNNGYPLESVDSNNKRQWSFNVSDLGGRYSNTLNNTIGAGLQNYHFDKKTNLIIFTISGSIAVIDSNSGKLKWAKFFRGATNRFFVRDSFIYVLSDLPEPVYRIFTVSSGEILFSIKLAEIWKGFTWDGGVNYGFSWKMTQHFVDDKYLYVTSFNQKELGIFNKDTAEIVDKIRLGNSNSLIPMSNSPQVVDRVIYQLDGDKNLYIFEDN